jgi:hypothetical protein
MMKKLLVLLMVIGVASVANAALVLSPSSVTPPGVVDIQANPLTAVDVQQAVFIVATGTVQLNAGTMLYTGTLSGITNMSTDPDLKALANSILGSKGAATRIDMVEMIDGTATPPAVTGRLATYNVLSTSGTGWVCMLDPDLTRMISSTEVVPEPVTITLLGLGGLMLRRRK